MPSISSRPSQPTNAVRPLELAKGTPQSPAAAVDSPLGTPVRQSPDDALQARGQARSGAMAPRVAMSVLDRLATVASLFAQPRTLAMAKYTFEFKAKMDGITQQALEQCTHRQLNHLESTSPGTAESVRRIREIDVAVANDIHAARQRIDKFVSLAASAQTGETVDETFGRQIETMAEIHSMFNDSLEGIAKNRQKSLRSALENGFKLEPGAMHQLDHPLWTLCEEIGVSRTPLIAAAQAQR